MIFHTIRFQLKDGVTQDQVEPVLQQLHKMGTEIPVIGTYCVGRDVCGDFNYGAYFKCERVHFTVTDVARDVCGGQSPRVFDAVSLVGRGWPRLQNRE